MDKKAAIDLLREYSRKLSEQWALSPEGRAYKARFDSAVDELAKEPPHEESIPD